MKKNYIFGFHSIMEAIKDGKEIEKIFIKHNLRGDLFFKLKKTLKEVNTPFQFVPIEKLNRITQENHQGVIAIMSPIDYEKLEEIIPLILAEGKNPVVLILDKITDVRNFGAITRSAECAGVDLIIVPDKNSAQINSDAIKTSSGALLDMPICRVGHLKDAIYYLKQNGLSIVATTEKADKIYYELDFKIPTAIIMGSEDKGVERGILKICDEKVKIPVKGKIKSLNVSVATGVIVYEILKQRTKF